MTQAPPPPADVAAAFDRFVPEMRARLLALRDLVFDVAAEDTRIGPLQEELRWRQPTYLTFATGAGTPVRLGLAKSGQPAVLVHCGTRIVADHSASFPGALRYEGNRAAIATSDIDALRPFVHAALTYRLT